MKIEKNNDSTTLILSHKEAEILEMLLASTDVDHYHYPNDGDQKIVSEISEAALSGFISNPS